MKDRLRSAREHVEAALLHLDIDPDLDRLLHPRHTDHDRHVYLPRKVAQELAAARLEIEAALEDLRSMTMPAVPDPPSE